MATLASLLVRITADSSQFIAGTKKAEAGLAGLGNKITQQGATMSRMGRSMTRGLTVPIVAVGTAAVKMSMDFETSMGHIRSLVGASEKDMKNYEKTVLRMAKTMPQGPKELADALYFVTSSGFKGAEALDILKQSARASAAGLGETQTVANVVTSAVNAYGAANLKASKATDILVAAVREGKAEPEEFGQVLGRVIPVAEAVGVEFHETAAGVASMTLSGLNAAEATTALRGIMMAIVKPSKDATKAFKALGFPVAEFRKQVAEEGLLPALQALRDRIGENDEMFGRVFPNVRALAGFLNLTGRNAEKNAHVFKELAAATGDTDRAFKKMAETSGFKLASAWSTMQVALIKFGDVLAPVVVKVAEFFEKLANAFTKLTPKQKEFVVQALAIVAALGPILFIVGKLTSGFGQVLTVIGRLAGGFKSGATAATAFKSSLTVVAAVVGSAMLAFQRATSHAEGLMDTLMAKPDASGLHEINDEIRELTGKVGNIDAVKAGLHAISFGLVGSDAALKWRQMSIEIDHTIESLAGATTQTDRIKLAQAEAAQATLRHAMAVELFGKDSVVAGERAADLARKTNALELAAHLSAVATAEQVYQEMKLLDIRKDLAGLSDGVARSEIHLREAKRTQADAQKLVNELVENGQKGTKEYRVALDQLRSAKLDVRSASRDLSGNLSGLGDKIDAATNLGKVSKGAFLNFADALGLSRKKVGELTRNFETGHIGFQKLIGSADLSKREIEILTKAFGQLQSRAKSDTQKAANEFMKLPAAIREAEGPALAAGRGVGDAMGRGLKLGLAAGIDGFAAAAANAVNSAESAAKNAIDARSPSRTFMRIGEDIVEGLRIGLANRTDALIREMRHTMGTITIPPEDIDSSRARVEIPSVASVSAREAATPTPVSRTIEAHFHGDTMADPKKAVKELDWMERTSPW